MEELITVTQETAEETPGKEANNNRKVEWFDKDCKNITTQKNVTSRRLQQPHRKKRKITKHYEGEKKMHQQKKREFMEKELQELEMLNTQAEAREFYRKMDTQKRFSTTLSMC